MTANLPTVQLPSHLAVLAGKSNTALAAIGGITIGASFHRISIKSSRWRLNDPQGQEHVVPTTHLDVIIVDANPTQSKIFYLSAYNPAETEYKAPDCYSDNGVAPSARAAIPQCGTCAQCPHNVWGSKITPSGAQTKACADVKKLAVILAENPTGPVYELRIPAASLKNLYAFVQSLNDRGVPLCSFVTRLAFDSQADYPKILFTPRPQTVENPQPPWCTPEQVSAVLEVIDTEEVNVVTNKNDKPIAGLPAKTGAALHPAPPIYTQSPAPAGMVPHVATPVQAPARTELAQPEPAKRVRRTKAEIAAAAAATLAPQASTVAASAPVQPEPAGDFFSTLKAKVPTAQIQVNPQPADAGLEALIATAMKA